MPRPPAPPALEYAATLSVRLAPLIDLERGPQGHRRLVPIVGGTLEGPLLNGEVLAGGMDNQVLWTTTLTELHAHYAVRLEDGALMYVDNAGVRSGSEEDMLALARGERVDPERIYFRTAPRLSSTAAGWEWLARTLFLGVGTREPDSVRLDVYRVG
jgi:Protein of unknown function (DUF3237)